MSRILSFLAILLLGLGLQAQDTTGLRQFENDNPEFFRQPTPFSYPEIQNGGGSRLVVNPANTGPVGITFDIPPRLQQAIDFQKRIASSRETMVGYRIQILTTADFQVAGDTKANFIKAYRDIPIYQTWDKTHFRLRAGDFMTKNEAMTKLAEVKKMFPGAFVVDDEVNLPKHKNPSPE